MREATNLRRQKLQCAAARTPSLPPHPAISINKKYSFSTRILTNAFSIKLFGWGGKDRFVEHQSWETKSIVWGEEFKGAIQAGEVTVFSHHFWKGIIIRESNNKFPFTLIDNQRAEDPFAVQHSHTVYKWPPNSGN